MNENKTIGMQIGYRRIAVPASLLLVLSLFLPYAKDGSTSYHLFALTASLKGAAGLGSYAIYLLALIATLALLLCDALLYLRPSKGVAATMSVLAAVAAGLYTVSLFASKRLIDGTAIFDQKFMVSHFGAGYWLGLILSYVTLFCAMKTAKIHPGYILLVLMSVIWLFPILWIVLTAFRAESGYYVGYFFPKHLTFDNFKNLFADTSVIHFGKWWLNTLFVASANCVCTTIIVLMTAFTLSKTRFTGRLGLMKTMLIIGMFPGFMSMVAVYNILKGLGIAQTLWALIIVNAAGAAMGYYIVKGFFDTIPKSLDEAALLDGATKWQVFTKITIPMSKSVIIYTILTSFVGPWGDYIFPSMMLGDNQSQYTVALGLNWLTDFRRIDTYYTQFAAGALLVSLPIVILFIVLQRFYVEGMSGAVKG